MEISYREIELQNGEKIKLTLNFAGLYKLRNKEPQLYEEYNGMIMDGIHDDLQNIRMIYIAYVCANLEEHMGFEEFLESAPFDREIINQAIGGMLTPSKKKEDL